MAEPMESTRTVARYSSGSTSPFTDRLAVERPIELRMDGVPLAVLMSSPGMESELALGFCLTEGILLSPDELADVRRFGPGDRFDLILAEGVSVDPERFRRNAYVSSSCGVCGKASIDAVRVAARSVPDGPSLPPELVASLPARLRRSQPGFSSTGALHAAALFTADGTLLEAAEDVGRHNAVDKAIGSLARRTWPPGQIVLVVSGRISFEIAQKAAVAGIPVVVGVSAASSLAVELADELGMTLIGFTRDGGFVAYVGDHRLTNPTAAPHPPD